MKTNKELRKDAREALRGKWAPAVIATIVYLVIVSAIYSPFAILGYRYGASYSHSVAAIECPSYILMFLVIIPLAVGFYAAFRLLFANGDTAVTSNMFKQGFTKYLHNIWGMLLMSIFLMLWTFLLIIPGIIKSFSYAMTPFILRDCPELSANQAIERSKKLMAGHKLKLFGMYLSFVGWALLAILTLCIGFLWLEPYMATSLAAFYEDLKAEEAASELAGA